MAEHHYHRHLKKEVTHHHEQGNLVAAFFLNASFTIIEIAGGIFTNSIAIISDAVHDLGDTFSLGLAWYAERLARRKPDSRYTYGYKRFPVLAAMVNSVFLLAASAFVFTQAIPLLMHPGKVNETGMIWLAILGIVFNGAAVLKLKGGKSLNQRVVRLHLLEDTLGWIAVLAGAIVMKLTGLGWIDPVMGVLIALFIIYNASKNLRDTLRIFLQAIPEINNRQALEKSLLSIPGVESFHDVRTWTIDGIIHVYTLHIVTRPGVFSAEYPAIKEMVRKQLASYGFGYVTIEIDSYDEFCRLNHEQ
ncbi:MAG: cation diffusion facilitator family transporter [Bacteroidota bacterium]